MQISAIVSLRQFLDFHSHFVTGHFPIGAASLLDPILAPGLPYRPRETQSPSQDVGAAYEAEPLRNAIFWLPIDEHWHHHVNEVVLLDGPQYAGRRRGRQLNGDLAVQHSEHVGEVSGIEGDLRIFALDIRLDLAGVVANLACI